MSPDPTMSDESKQAPPRHRPVLPPVAYPMLGLVFGGILVFSFSRVLLAVSKTSAAAIALLMALNVLIGTGLASCHSMTDRHERLDAFEARTRQFSVKVLRLLGSQAWPPVLLKVVQQLASSATSVAANHRAVRRARSTREFAAKLQVVNEEIDETVHWLETLKATDMCLAQEKLAAALKEARELRAIFAKARKTTRTML